MKNKSTKRALFSSMLALILCFSMLVGTTFAWFTDEVKSGTNKIVAGNLDVELYNGLDVKAPKVTEETKLFHEITYWEPGVVAFENLTVANEGTLALKYQLAVNFANATANASGDTLAEVLMVGFVEGGINTTDRTAALAMVKTWLPLESFAQEGTLAAEEAVTYGIVIYWAPTENDNDFNLNNDYEGEPLSIDLGVNLYATQMEAEWDSFGSDYDEESSYNIAKDDTAVFGGASFTKTVFNYGTVEINAGEMNTPDAALDNYGTAILNGVKMDAGSTTDYALRAGAGSVTVLNDVTLDAKGGALSAVNGAQMTINGGTYYLNTASTSGRYMVYAVGEGTVVTINGGDFSINPNTNNKRGYAYVGAGATVYVTGGNFAKASLRSGYNYFGGEGTVVITGGTFGFDPTNWVAAGYKAEKDGSTWTVLPKGTDSATLKDALNNGEKTIALGSGEFAMPSLSGKEDITIIGAADGSTVIGGQNVSTGFASNFGKNTTIQNVTFAGSSNGVRWSYAQGGTSTFENCTFAGGSTYGFHIDSAKNATFIFNNCTFSGFNAFAGDLEKVVFNNCTFKSNGYYGHTNIWSVAEFNNCTFENATFGPRGDAKIYIDGTPVVYTAEALASMLTSDAEEINVMLGENIDLPINSLGQQTGGSGEYKLGGENTKAITIDLNGNKLNITTTYWSSVGAKNDDAIFTVKNGTMTSSQASGTWNSYDVTFANCNYVVENVVFEKAVAFTNAGKAVTLTNVTINETHDYYALWITAEGQNVVIDGLTVNSAGRGIKIDEQYVETPAKVTLSVSNAKFVTAKKAAIMVKSVEGADITVNNVDIAGVAADTTNVVWVDSDSAAHADKVTVNGAPAVVEP